MASFWQEHPVDEASVAALMASGFDALQARLLALRAVTPESKDVFFSSDFAFLSDPFELPGIKEGTRAIRTAIANNARIVIFGDYDCDGICATTILTQTLRALGADVLSFLPERLTEGYGLNNASLQRLLSSVPNLSLLVTVDNGINSISQVAELKSRGIEVVITDHHLPGDEIPDCTVINPKVAASERLSNLCGAGVAFMLANALVSTAKKNKEYDGPNIGGSLLILAGLATVTDIMPLLGENRILVSNALKRFRAWAPIGLKELFDRAARSTPNELTARDFAFLLGPRLNAAGRMASATDALDLLLAENREDAREKARIVDTYNTTRKTIEHEMFERAIKQIVPGASAQVIALDGPNAHSGVAGIVAARILEKLTIDNAVPVVVVVNGRGSARSPEGYNIRQALESSSEALESFGGHAAAGGLTLIDGKIDRFRELFSAACLEQTKTGKVLPQGLILVDAEITGEDITFDFAQWLEKLEPFGEANPAPIFALRNVYFMEVKTLGAEARHLQVLFKNSKIPRAVWWNHGEAVEQLRKESAETHDVIFTIEMSNYRELHPELRLLAILPTRKESNE